MTTTTYVIDKLYLRQVTFTFVKCIVTAKKSDEKSNENIESKKATAEVQEKKDEASKDNDSRSTKSTSKKPESDRGRRDEKRIRSWDHHRSHTRSRSRERRRRDDVLTFAKIRVNAPL